jgi:hypothetical protein
MKIKYLILIGMILLVIFISLYGKGLKENISKELLENVENYNCENTSFCTSCVVNEQTCNCDTNSCVCGKETLDKNTCNLFSPS